MFLRIQYIGLSVPAAFLFTKIAIVDGATLNTTILMKRLTRNALYANRIGFLGHPLLWRTGDCNHYSNICELEL